MLEIGALFLVGMGISTVLVRRSSRGGIDIELTWAQAFRVVTLRACAGILTGFLIGRLVGLAITSGWITWDTLKVNVWYLVALGFLCATSSLLTYRAVMQKTIRGKLSVVATVRLVLIEVCHYAAILLVIFLLAVVAVTAFEFSLVFFALKS